MLRGEQEVDESQFDDLSEDSDDFSDGSEVLQNDLMSNRDTLKRGSGIEKVTSGRQVQQLDNGRQMMGSLMGGGLDDDEASIDDDSGSENEIDRVGSDGGGDNFGDLDAVHEDDEDDVISDDSGF